MTPHPQRALFHIVDARRWQSAVGRDEYRPESLHVEGFVHCSFAEQLARTARTHFAATDDLVVLQLDPAAIAAPIRVEDVGNSGAAFPHVYGPIPARAVVRVLGLSDLLREIGAALPDR